MANGIPAAKAHITSNLRYVFEDDDLVHQALDISGCGTVQGNRRLLWVIRHSAPFSSTTGVASGLLSTVASNGNLARLGRAAGLESHIIVHAGQFGMAVSDKTLATTVEAVLGAIYLDSNKDLGAVRAAMAALQALPVNGAA